VRKELRTMSLLGLLFCAAGCLLRLAAKASELDAWAGGPATLWALLARTHYGHLIASGLALVVLLLCTYRAKAWNGVGRHAHLVEWALLCALAACLGNIGHGGAPGLFSESSLDASLHTLFAGLWAGLIVASSHVVLRRLSVDGPAPTIRAYLRWHSALATVGMAGVLMTGVVRAAMTPGLFHQVNSQYAILLLAKTVLVIAAIGIGGYLRVTMVPVCPDPAGKTDLRKGLAWMRLDALLMCAILVAASTLAATAVPGE
jgi:hypothetical protein